MRLLVPVLLGAVCVQAELVELEGLDTVNPDQRQELQEGSHRMAEMMLNMWKENPERREQLRCAACVAVARHVMPVMKGLQDNVEKTSESDLDHHLSKVCQDDGPDVGIKAYHMHGLELTPVNIHNPWMVIPSPTAGGSHPTVKAVWTVEVINSVCVEVTEEHGDSLRDCTSLKEIISEICVKKTNFCERTDFLHFLNDEDRTDINTAGPIALLAIKEKVTGGDIKVRRSLKCSAQYAVSDTVNWRARVIWADRKNETGLSEEDDYTMRPQDFELAATQACEEEHLKDAQWGLSFDWFRNKAEPIYIAAGGIKLPADFVAKDISDVCNEMDHTKIVQALSSAQSKSYGGQLGPADIVDPTCGPRVLPHNGGAKVRGQHKAEKAAEKKAKAEADKARAEADKEKKKAKAAERSAKDAVRKAKAAEKPKAEL